MVFSVRDRLDLPATRKRRQPSEPVRMLLRNLPGSRLTAVSRSTCRPSLWRHTGTSTRWNSSQLRRTAAASSLSLLGMLDLARVGACVPTPKGMLGIN